MGDDTRAWLPPVRDGISTYYLAVNRNKRSVALDLKDDDDVGLARELAGRADVMIENFRPGGLDRFGLGYDDVAAGNPRVVYASISGFGTTERGRVLPGLRPDRPGDVGADEPDRRSRDGAFPIRDLRVRRDGRDARDASASSPPSTRATSPGAASTSRSTCSPPRCRGWSTRPARTSPAASCRTGWATPTRACIPYEPIPCADGELIITSGNNVQFRKLVRGARRARARGRPALHEHGGPQRPPRRAPAAADRAAEDPHRRWSGSATSSPPACRAGRSTTSRQGVGFADRDRARTGRRGRRGRRDGAVDPAPDHVLRDAVDYRLPPPSLDEHGEEIRRWLGARVVSRRSHLSHRTRRDDRRAAVPDVAGHVDRRRDPAARAEPDRGPDGPGRVRRARVLAGGTASADAVRRCASSRRCWSRSPTTASRRPRSLPASPISPRPTRCRVRWPPGCSGAGHGSSA